MDGLITILVIVGAVLSIISKAKKQQAKGSRPGGAAPTRQAAPARQATAPRPAQVPEQRLPMEYAWSAYLNPEEAEPEEQEAEQKPPMASDSLCDNEEEHAFAGSLPGTGTDRLAKEKDMPIGSMGSLRPEGLLGGSLPGTRKDRLERTDLSVRLKSAAPILGEQVRAKPALNVSAQDMRRAVVMAEVLGRPKALRPREARM